MKRGKNLAWRDAIVKVLREADGAMPYTDVADAVVEQELRQDVGATPAKTVSAVITSDLRQNGEDSIFERVNPGEYLLRKSSSDARPDSENRSNAEIAKAADLEDEAGIIQAFGMYWQRDLVNWNKPQLLGQQSHKAKSVNFSDQVGVYLLHDGR